MDDEERRRREVGDTDAPVEDEVQESFEATVEEGAERLHRDLRTILVTGFFGGLEVGIGVIAMLAVLHETGSHLLAGLAFSAGLIALLLAHSELFTENFLMPVAAVVAREGHVGHLAKLWTGTLVANLLGGCVVMWLVVQAFPEWHAILEESARHFVDAPFDLQSVALAVLGGSTITLMTRMQQGTNPTRRRSSRPSWAGSSSPGCSCSTRSSTRCSSSARSRPVSTSRTSTGWAGSGTRCCSTCWAGWSS